jgi:hypothetical protein
LAVLLAFATAQPQPDVGPAIRTTITGPDGGQIIKDEYTGFVPIPEVVYTLPSTSYYRYTPYPLPYTPYPLSYASYARYSTV